MSKASETTLSATVFSALGDTTRLELVKRLGDGERHSIVQLAEGLGITRQGVTKHLQVLQRADIVSSERVGRESLYSIKPAPIAKARDYLIRASAQWDANISRLKTKVEKKRRGKG